MASWKPLRSFLADIENSVTLTWRELDELVGGLPPSAANYREFWAGDRSGWPGFRTRDVRMGKQVTFERVSGSQSATKRAATNYLGIATRLSDGDDLLLRAAAATGISDREALVREGLESLIRVASARQLAGLGGTDPNAASAPRHRDGGA